MKNGCRSCVILCECTSSGSPLTLKLARAVMALLTSPTGRGVKTVAWSPRPSHIVSIYFSSSWRPPHQASAHARGCSEKESESACDFLLSNAVHAWLHCQQAQCCPRISINTIWVGCLRITSVRRCPLNLTSVPGEAADGTWRWQGVSPVDPARWYASRPRPALLCSDALPHASGMSPALQDAMNSCKDRINTSFGRCLSQRRMDP